MEGNERFTEEFYASPLGAEPGTAQLILSSYSPSYSSPGIEQDSAQVPTFYVSVNAMPEVTAACRALMPSRPHPHQRKFIEAIDLRRFQSMAQVSMELWIYVGNGVVEPRHSICSQLLPFARWHPSLTSPPHTSYSHHGPS